MADDETYQVKVVGPPLSDRFLEWAVRRRMISDVEQARLALNNALTDSEWAHRLGMEGADEGLIREALAAVARVRASALGASHG